MGFISLKDTMNLDALTIPQLHELLSAQMNILVEAKEWLIAEQRQAITTVMETIVREIDNRIKAVP